MNSGDAYLHFDGFQSYIEIPDSPDFSLTTSGALTVSAWIRPSTLTFPSTEGKGVDLSKAYVHWLGKGETGQQEWVFRMYSLDSTDGRANRISFYVSNPDGGLGVGSYYQDRDNPIQAVCGSTYWDQSGVQERGRITCGQRVCLRDPHRCHQYL
ncbi:MAG TPA: hypothetical protein VKM54_22990 [Myxococcota bacterium]|nr:hypothetical protein [Myxococcota bacterium]